MREVAIVGIGIHPFGPHEDISGLDMGAVAARAALEDAGLTWSDMEFAYGGSVASGAADALVSRLGLTALPFVNVANGCATGGSSVLAAVHAIQSGAHDIGLVVGFDKHGKGAFNAPPSALGLPEWYAQSGLMLTTQFFGMKIQRYMHDHGISVDTLAKVAVKASQNGALNENSWRRKPVDEERVLGSYPLAYPLTQFMFCNPGEGGVALVLTTTERAADLVESPVQVLSVALTSRPYGSFEVFSPAIASERAPSPTVEAAQKAFGMAGITPRDVDVAQIQDTESGAEVIHMGECGLCDHGEQEELIQAGETTVNGTLPINTDGGCLTNGEPIGASGLRQVYENVLQLRGAAGDRQVPGSPKIAFSHVYGAPGISACAVLARAD